MKLLAETTIAPPGGFRGFGNLGLEGLSEESGGTIFNMFLSSTIGVITVVAFIWFVFILFTGAIGIMSSGGDKQALENARNKIRNGVIGLIVVIAGIFIYQLVGSLFGIENILNPGEIIRQIGK